jgi:FkbH-like protein
MEALTYSQIQETLSAVDSSKLPELNIAVLRNIMLEPIEPYLRYEALQAGYHAHVSFGSYDNIFQEAVGGNSQLFEKKINCILIYTYLETLAPNLARQFAGLSQAQAEAEVARIQDFINAVLAGVRRQTDGMILWHSFEIPLYPSLGIRDAQIEGQVAIIRRLNEFLRRKVDETPNAYFVDLSLCRGRVGASGFYDRRYWQIARAPYGRDALREIASEDFKFIRALVGRNRKCLVLDCDNTLWGGIIGEDGLAGITLGRNYPGSAFYEFQQEILNLHHRGVIVALCSKNNEADVWEVFRKHPDMVLREDHIAAAQINWEDKVSNLRQLALALNIGLDSMVYADDSEFEVGLVQRELPEVAVIHMPAHKTFDYAHLLASCGYFDTLTISEEDLKRGDMYRAELGRKQLQAQATDMESYYNSLEMVLDIHLADDFSVPRIAQLTQKTNQFNLTTRRYTEADIKRMKDSDTSDVLYLKLTDNYGDSGIVGACLLHYQQDRAILDSFLLSCRVLGRGVEDVLLIHALRLARKRGCQLVIGEYCATGKNDQVKLFYQRQGFQAIDGSTQQADQLFQYRLSQELRREPAYFKAIKSDVDQIS